MNRRHASPPHFEFARQKRKYDSCISRSLMLEVFWIDDLKCLPCSILNVKYGSWFLNHHVLLHKSSSCSMYALHVCHISHLFIREALSSSYRHPMKTWCHAVSYLVLFSFCSTPFGSCQLWTPRSHPSQLPWIERSSWQSAVNRSFVQQKIHYIWT